MATEFGNIGDPEILIDSSTGVATIEEGTPPGIYVGQFFAVTSNGTPISNEFDWEVTGVLTEWTPNFNNAELHLQLDESWIPAGNDWRMEFEVGAWSTSTDVGIIIGTFILPSTVRYISSGLTLPPKNLFTGNGTTEKSTFGNDLSPGAYGEWRISPTRFQVDINGETVLDDPLGAGQNEITMIGGFSPYDDGIGIGWRGNLLLTKLIDHADEGEEENVNTINPQWIIQSVLPPTVTEIFDTDTGLKLGDLVGLPIGEEWIPVRRGGEIDRTLSQLKEEHYCSNFSEGNWELGIDIDAQRITSSGQRLGSFTGFLAVGDILVSRLGMIIQIDLEVNPAEFGYIILQGNNTEIFESYSFPNVWRRLKPDISLFGEYLWYATGGAYPWTDTDQWPPLITDHLDRFNNLSGTEQNAMADFIYGCWIDGTPESNNWNNLDEFWCFALNNIDGDWLIGWKSHEVTDVIGGITRTSDGALTTGSSLFGTDYTFGPLFTQNDAILGCFIHTAPTYINSFNVFLGVNSATPIDTRAYIRFVSGAQQMSSTCNHGGIINDYDNIDIAGNLHSVKATASQSHQWVNGDKLPANTGTPTRVAPTLPLTIFCRNEEENATDLVEAGTIITSVWAGAQDGFDLALFEIRLRALQDALQVDNVTMSVSWIEPTERVDGSPLVAIASYDIEHSALGQQLTTVNVLAPATSVVLSVPPGQNRARITAIDVNGKRSQLSGFVFGVAI